MSDQKLQQLKSQVREFPRLPGVYLMRDQSGAVIYVGKAKNLRERVKSYFAGGDGRYQIQFLMERVDALEKIIVESEEQALVLERDLITKFKPRYNIRLKDDKAYLSIRIDENQEWPRLELVRKVEQDGARYFGPYTYSYEVHALLDIIQRVLPLRNCSDNVLYNGQRPCLEYQIKRCAGPCCIPVDREQYRGWLKQAQAILEGKVAGLKAEFVEEMEAEAAALHFEEAAGLRDRIAVLENFSKSQVFSSPGAESRDVFALYREERLAVLSILRVRLGRLAGNQNFHFDNVEVPDQEVIETAIEQYYEQGRDVPEEIVLPREVSPSSFLQSWLKNQRGAVVSFTAPKRGVKFRLLQLALLNARQHYIETFNAEARRRETAQALARLCKLPQIPRRIECVDISNLQGSDIVGALVAFNDGVPHKEAYKKYRISFQDKPDDFAAIYEVVLRRLRRGFEAQDLPDLMIIDGGQGQLQAALAAREKAGIKLDIIALAKERSGGSDRNNNKPERIFLEGAAESLPLEGSLELTHLIARIRDEAHRFVIQYHRGVRSRRILGSALDDISGVGPERKRRLLEHFGSIKKIAEAAVEDIARTGRMPLALAQKVIEGLRS